MDRKRAATLDRIDRICATDSDAQTLRIQVRDELRRVVPFDAYVWLLTDPSTAVGCAPLADVPCLHELPRLIKTKYLTQTNRWTSLAADRPAAGALHASTGGDLSGALVWRDVLSRYEITDVASVVFEDRYGCWAFLDLWRSHGKDPFSSADVDLLAELAARLTEALRHRQALTFSEPAVSQRHNLGPVVILLDDDLNIIGQTPATQEWLRTLIPQEAGQPVIPSSVYNVAGQLLAKEAGVDDHDAFSRVHLAEGFWVSLRAARLGGEAVIGEAPAGATTIAVTLEECAPLERLEVFARSFALSRRERELMTMLATGSDTRDLARRLFLSEHTVQDHLKSIFAKTSARTRNALLSRALGVSLQDRA